MLREVSLGLTYIVHMRLLYPLSNLWAGTMVSSTGGTHCEPSTVPGLAISSG